MKRKRERERKEKQKIEIKSSSSRAIVVIIPVSCDRITERLWKSPGSGTAARSNP
jgi:hypothetical protein